MGDVRLTLEMKTLIATLTLAVAGVSSAHAQMYQPAATRGAVLGAIAGALVGGHNHDRWGEGAVIGGVAGALLGAALAPQEPVYQSPVPVYQSPAVVYGQSAPLVQSAPVVPMALTVQQAAPQVVYVESAPRVVYVQAPPPAVVYLNPPPVSFGFGYYSGPRHPVYYPPVRYPMHSHGHHRR
ncbi:MAG: hypothetical protein EXS38_05750 [Opitutus sp.]|nr:hypothetical protein [Opitutus sp.]